MDCPAAASKAALPSTPPVFVVVPAVVLFAPVALAKPDTLPVEKITPESDGNTPGLVVSPSVNVADEAESPKYVAELIVNPEPVFQ